MSTTGFLTTIWILNGAKHVDAACAVGGLNADDSDDDELDLTMGAGT